MKNTMKMLGMLALVVLSLAACRKKEDAKPQPQTTKQFAMAIQMQSQKSEPQKAILIGSKAELEAAAQNKEGVRVMRVSDRNPLFRIYVPPVTGDPNKPDPYNPETACWKEIHAYYEAHYGEWLAQANANCRDVYVCLSCPKTNFGLNVLYYIQPNSPKCLVMEEEQHIVQMRPFDFGEEDYDTETVAAYIQRIAK